jgi:sorting nexin-29
MINMHNLVTEFFKCGGRALKEGVHKSIIQIWEQEQVPDDWNVRLIFPIFKKGDRTECRNYRGITLLNVAYKIFPTVLARKLSPYSEEILDGYQCGFHLGRSAIEKVFVLR